MTKQNKQEKNMTIDTVSFRENFMEKHKLTVAQYDDLVNPDFFKVTTSDEDDIIVSAWSSLSQEAPYSADEIHSFGMDYSSVVRSIGEKGIEFTPSSVSNPDSPIYIGELYRDIIERYSDSEVVGGEFILFETFSDAYTEKEVNEALAYFYSWDRDENMTESPSYHAVRFEAGWAVVDKS
jgi:hypothetical protein